MQQSVSVRTGRKEEEGGKKMMVNMFDALAIHTLCILNKTQYPSPSAVEQQVSDFVSYTHIHFHGVTEVESGLMHQPPLCDR